MPQDNITILDKTYTVACEPHEQEALHKSAKLVDEKMREIRQNGKTIGSERVAVMAALNLAHELLQERSGELAHDDSIKARLRLLHEKINGVMDGVEFKLNL